MHGRRTPHKRLARPWAVVALLLALAFAGCAGSSAPKAGPSTSPPPTTQATVTVDTGGIEGLVTDDESAPVAGAEVGILKSTVPSTRTDDAGRFAFSDLAPGDYTLIASRLGYKEKTTKVTVVAGEVAEATIVLEPLPVGPQYEPNELGAGQNTLYLQIKSASPRYWLSTTKKEATANSNVGGYNPLGFVIGAEPGAATWSIPMNPALPKAAKLDKSKPIVMTLYIGGCLEGIDSGYVTVTTNLKADGQTLMEGEAKTFNYAGNLVKLEWSVNPALETLEAEASLTWSIRAAGFGSQICLGAYSVAPSNIVFPAL